MNIREYLKKEKLICDGAFGTYFMQKTGKNLLPEQANLEMPELVTNIHMEYLEAGAVLLRTNTFASNKETLHCDEEALKKNIRAGYRNACQAVEKSGKKAGENCFIAGDIGPIPGSFDMEEAVAQYRQICQAFLEEGTQILIFETFPDMERILPVIRELKAEKDIFIIVQFCVNQHGYSNAGISASHLLKDAAGLEEIDAVGFNCGVGPGHLYRILEKLNLPKEKFITALPNAGYPQLMRNQMVFRDDAEYFAGKMKEIASLGIDILGGCCGTGPEYIRKVAAGVDREQTAGKVWVKTEEPVILKPSRDSSFWNGKQQGEKLIAVELSPPPGADDDKVMEAAFYLKDKSVDVLTFPDSPSGRTRADSVLMGLKAGQETKLCVMPHICCRDKNAIAMRSQLLGAYINGIRNLLVITGDPVPTLIRQEVKSVFNFDSVGLMKIINELNQEEFAKDPMVFGGALNYNRPNLSVEIKRIERKKSQGASFFLTQPVFTREDAEKLKIIKEETGARILCGVMPLVSLKNALFMKNEMAGIHVTEEIISRFSADMTRQEGEQAGISLAQEVIGYTENFVDGFYLSIPFNRTYLIEKILI